jgi:hypothetical protein
MLQLLYHRPMQIRTGTGDVIDLDDRVILALAGKIYAGRRKHHGGPAKRVFPCPWCDQPCAGRSGLEAHQRLCAQTPGAGLAQLLGAVDITLLPTG